MSVAYSDEVQEQCCMQQDYIEEQVVEQNEIKTLSVKHRILEIETNYEKQITIYFCTECKNYYDSLESHEQAVNSKTIDANDNNDNQQTQSIIKNTSTYNELDENELLFEEHNTSTDTGTDTMWQLVNVTDNVQQLISKEQPETFKTADLRAFINDEAILEDYNKYILNAQNDKQFICCDCNALFNDIESAEQHKCSNAATATTALDPLNNKDVEVNKVPKQKMKRVNAKENVKTPEEPVKCTICNTFFRIEKHLKSHMRMHKERTLRSIDDVMPPGTEYIETNQFYCEICNKNFNQSLLPIHMKMHQNKVGQTCNICNRKFDPLSYEIHSKLHTTGKDNFMSKIKITQKKNKSDNLPYACQHCGYKFARPYEKVKHERIHTGEKPYHCEICGKNFRVSYSLTMHLRTHTNVRLYACELCNKSFKSQQNYSHHMRAHSNERKYNCDLCSKTFCTSVQLHAHKNCHLKPYSCTVCNRSFSSLYAVKIHMANTHDSPSKVSNVTGNVHICQICGAQYTRQFALRLHEMESHSSHTEPQKHPAKQIEATTKNEVDAASQNTGQQTQHIEQTNVANKIFKHVKWVEDVNITDFTEKLELDLLGVDSYGLEEEVITDW